MGQMRVHKIETVNTCLNFLKEQNVQIRAIGAEDIVDGKPKLILGLIWLIILRFHIKDIDIFTSDSEDEDAKNNNKEVANEHLKKDESKPKHSTKEALVLWCQKRTRGYEHVNVRDFSGSWRNGMAFNALIHSHNDKLVDFTSLNPKNHIENLNNAFTIAREHLDIQPLLDAEDVDTDKPDEHSILTYVSSFYHSIANDGFNYATVVELKSTMEEKIDAQASEPNDAPISEEIIQPKLIEKVDVAVPSTLTPQTFELGQGDDELTRKEADQVDGTRTSVAVGDESEQSSLFLWVIVVAVGFTILRNIFNNTAQWFMGDVADNMPSKT